MIPGPVRVLVVDVDSPVPAVTVAEPVGALVFVRRYGRLIGAVELDLPAGGRTGAELTALLHDAIPEPPPGAEVRLTRPPDTELPLASVVMATRFDRGALVDAALASLAGSDYPHFEIILVDNRPTNRQNRRDWTRLPPDPRLRILSEPRPGASAARNAGVRAARGDIIAFTDDDAEVDAGWLRALVSRLLAEPEAGCVTGPVLPKELQTPAQRYFERHGFGRSGTFPVTTYRTGVRPGTRPWARDRFRVCDPAGRRVGWLYELGRYGTGANMAFRADTLAELAGFDESLGPGTPARAGEDLALFVRLLFAGGRLAVEPGAVVFHTHRRTESELRQQIHGYGSGLTAMLTAIAVRDPRHLPGYARVVLPALATVLRRRRRPAHGQLVTPPPRPALLVTPPPRPALLVTPPPRPGRPSDELGGLRRIRWCGLLHGPWDYLRGRRRVAR